MRSDSGGFEMRSDYQRDDLMHTHLNYLMAKEKTADLRRAAQRARLAQMGRASDSATHRRVVLARLCPDRLKGHNVDAAPQRRRVEAGLLALAEGYRLLAIEADRDDTGPGVAGRWSLHDYTHQVYAVTEQVGGGSHDRCRLYDKDGTGRR
jgi:hypothetical protein